MSFSVSDLVSGLDASREHFLKHLNGLCDDQWDWKPYPECKSIRETLAHLVSDDRASLEFLKTGSMPDFDAIGETETDVEKLLALLSESHKNLTSFILERFADAPLDMEVVFFAGKVKLGIAIAECASEDSYHAGQVSFIRMATDPSWDYYGSIYGA